MTHVNTLYIIGDYKNTVEECPNGYIFDHPCDLPTLQLRNAIMDVGHISYSIYWITAQVNNIFSHAFK